MQKVKSIESSRLLLISDNGQESVVWLVFVRTSADLALTLGEGLRSRLSSHANDLRVINASITDAHLVALFSSQEYHTALWEESLQSIVSWFEARGIEWGSDVYELMSAAHFELDYPSEFAGFMHTHMNVTNA